MRSKIAQRILNDTPEDVKIFVRLYTDLTVRINQILKEKGISQKELADRLGKKPSEISKWLNSEHNFTMRSIAKLQAELGEELIAIPQKRQFEIHKHGTVSMTVLRNTFKSSNQDFESFELTTSIKIHGHVS